MKNKQYFPFIDTVKGLGVFCVLITHMSWVVGYNQSLLTNFVSTFFLGVLFIASGFVSGKIWQDNVTWKTLLNGKYYRILVPFLVVGVFFVILKDLNLTGEISKNPFRKLLMELFNGGYWYLLSLFIYRIATILTQIITSNYAKPRLLLGGGNILIFCVLIFLTYLASKYLGISIILNHFYYFLLGILFYEMYSLIKSISYRVKDIIYASMILLLVVLFTFNQFYQSHYLGRSVLIGIVSSVTIFIICKRAGKSSCSEFFRWIGRFSLDVYVLHYFFLIGAHNLIDRNWFINLHWLVQASVLIFGAAVLLMCSYLLSKLIRSSKVLTKLTLGC